MGKKFHVHEWVPTIGGQKELCRDCGASRQVSYREPEARARTTDPATSHVAASLLSPEQLRESQSAVLAHFRNGASTDEELVQTYNRLPLQSPSGLRTRRHELVELGVLRDSGRRAKLRSGRTAIVWEVSDADTQ